MSTDWTWIRYSDPWPLSDPQSLGELLGPQPPAWPTWPDADEPYPYDVDDELFDTTSITTSGTTGTDPVSAELDWRPDALPDGVTFTTITSDTAVPANALYFVNEQYLDVYGPDADADDTPLDGRRLSRRTRRLWGKRRPERRRRG